MSHLQTSDNAPATADLAALYRADQERLGYVANYTKTFSPRPAVYRAWLQLNGAIKATMDPRRYEVATLEAAKRLRSSYCCLAHGQVLATDHLTEEQVRGLMAEPAADITPLDAAVARLAGKVTDDASAVTESDFGELRELGLTDPEILDVILAAAARCFFSTVLEATGTEPDPAYRHAMAKETVAALTVGRPIASR